MEECQIKFPGPVSKKTVTYLVIEYLKCVLHAREQLPFFFDHLEYMKENELQKSSEHPKIDNPLIYSVHSGEAFSVPDIVNTASTAKRRKFYETITKFEEFFKELARILETNNVMEIVLNLGPNIMNPEELYHIRMPLMCTNEECATDYASLQDCKEQFIQKIYNSDILEASRLRSLLPISVLLLLENYATVDKHMEQIPFYTLPKNCKQRTVNFIDKCRHLDDDSLQVGKYQHIIVSNGASASIKASGLWVKLKPELNGFKFYM